MVCANASPIILPYYQTASIGLPAANGPHVVRAIPNGIYIGICLVSRKLFDFHPLPNSIPEQLKENRCLVVGTPAVSPTTVHELFRPCPVITAFAQTLVIR